MDGLHRDLLPAEGAHEFVQEDRKTDGRGVFPELLQKMVIPSAPDDRVPCAESIRAENDAGVVAVISDHAQVKGNMVVRAVKPEETEDLLEPCDRKPGVQVRRSAHRLFQHLRPACEFREETERLSHAFFYFMRIQDLLDPEEIPVCDQRTDLSALLFPQPGCFQEAADKVHMPEADLEFLKPDLFQAVRHHCQHLRIRFHRVQPDQLRAELCILL